VLSYRPKSAPQMNSMHDPDTRPYRAPEKLRELAIWYRQFAERAGSSVIWEARLRMAEDLEIEADRLGVWRG
jgi:hypothetical protein